MKRILFLLALLCLERSLHAQYVYTIKADSVKITNTCDTAELIIENHSQTVPGFLFNKGFGRTEFRKALVKVNDTIYLIGADTLKILQPIYTAGLGLSESPYRTFNNNLTTGVAGGQTIIGSTSDDSGLEIRATSNAAATTGADIRFTAGNNGAKETMRILNNGNVGIGAPFPNHKLVLMSPAGTNEVSMAMVNNSNADLLTLGTNADGSATMTVPLGALNMFSQNGISFGSGDGVLRVSPGGQVSINECCPQYRFHVFENRISSSNSRAGFFWNAANVNATNGPVTNVGVYGQVESVRLSGSNTLTNVGVYGMVTDADDGYGGVFELNSADSFRVRYPLQVVHSSSRPVVNGMGVGIQLRAQNSAGANQVSGTLDCQYTNITAGSESADFSVRLINNGTNVEKLRVRSSGELNIGDFTDQGSFTLQNTGAFYQNGGINTKVSTISSSTSIDGSYHFIKVDASGGDIVIILPPASTVFVNNTGITYIFKRMDNVTANTVTVMRTGSDVIDGGASMSLATRYEVKNLTATGPAEWSIH